MGGSGRASTRTSSTRPGTASPRSPSTAPRCATPSGRPRCSRCRRAFEAARDDPKIGVVILTGAGHRGLLLGRRPADPRRRRLRRPEGHRPPQRARPADPDPPPAQAGRGHGRGLRHRRRPRAARRLRPDHRRRQRPLRPDRPARRQLRRRLRRRPAGPHRRPEEGARDLVPVRAVRRAAGARHGPGQQGRAAGATLEEETVAVVPARCSSSARSRCAC